MRGNSQKHYKTKMSSDSEAANYGPIRKTKAIKDKRRPLAIQDQDATVEFNSAPAKASSISKLKKIQVQRRRRLHMSDPVEAAGGSSDGPGQQALRKQPPLVSYGPGVRQSQRGGGKTISGLAPVLEFNETADDPYAMRPPIQ